MAAKREAEKPVPSAELELGVYVDSSALAKLYVPELESERLEQFLRGRRDLMISELSVTEVLSAVARRRREGALDVKQAREIRDAIVSDAASGSFRRLDLTPATHREAERILLSTESVPLRTLDALHLALAIAGDARRIVTFDGRMAVAANLYGLQVVPL